MTGPAARAAPAVATAAVRAPFTGRARRDIAFCVLTLPLILPGPVVGFAVTIGLAQAVGPPWVAGGNPSWLAMLTAVAVAVLTAALMVATGAARALAAASRRAAGRLLGEHVPPPPPRSTRIGDGPGWRAMAYLMLKLPAGLAECYAVGIFWVAGLVNLTYPFWWLSFRNHSPGVRLNPVGYLLKDRVADVSEFTDAVSRVAAGGTALDREVVSRLLAAGRHAGDLEPLTPRERDVLALMAEGRSNAGVATALVLSLGTVEKHVASIFGKLGLPASDTDNRRVLAVLRYLGS
jgi:DNA-binding CsgD family transcriptional regulator